MPIKFSIIIPVYNKKPHIKRCLDSVFKQTNNEFEVIIIDDNSTDGSLEEIKKYDDSRINVYRRTEPGPGGYAARNLGIEKAKYEWIAFLDADDEWYPDHLESISKTIKNISNVGIVGAGFKAISGNDEITQSYFIKNKKRGGHRLTFSDFLKIYLKNQRFGNTSVSAVKKDIIKKVGGFPAGKTNKGGDLYTWIKIFSICDGAWSPHIGANTYHDAVNKVTNTSYFNIDFLKTIVDEINVKESDLKLLKKYINSLIIKDYIRYLVSNRERKFYLTNKVFFTDVKKKMLYLALDIIPGFLLRKLILMKRFNLN